MTNIYKKVLSYTTLGVLTVTAGLVLFASPASAVDVLDCTGPGRGSDVCQAQGDDLFGAGGLWTNIINMLLFLAGAVAVLMIIIGGIKYITSNGDQSQISSAKNTILYSVIGLILAIMAGGIVNFVLGEIG